MTISKLKSKSRQFSAVFLLRHSIIIIMLAAMGLAHAATYYVAITGSDSNNGSSASPFKTIQKAADTVQPGDQVIVKSGIHYGGVTMKTSGLPGKPIVFQSEQGGAQSQWNTVIDASIPNALTWQAAPEVGAGVYKTTSVNSQPTCVTLDGDKNIFIIHSSCVAWPAGGWDWMSSAPDAERQTWYVGGFPTGVPMKFWDAAVAMAAFKDGINYIRFGNLDDPNKKNIRYSSTFAAITIDKSFIVVKGFKIRGSHTGIYMKGASCNNNIVEDNFVVCSKQQIYLLQGPAKNVIRNNKMTFNKLGTYSMGAWNGYSTDYLYRVRDVLYQFGKQDVCADNRSDQMTGVQLQNTGDSNDVSGNEIFELGIAVYISNSPNVLVRGNMVRNTVSSSIVVDHAANVQIFDNKIQDTHQQIRIFSIEQPNLFKGLYIYRNCFWNPRDLECSIYINGYTIGSRPQDFVELYFYHNSFSGSSGSIVGGTFVDSSSGKMYALNKTLFVNNIFSSPIAMDDYAPGDEYYNDPSMMGGFDYNWIGDGGWGGQPVPAWNGIHDVIMPGRPMWDDQTAAPDFHLSGAMGASAIDKGIDVSKSFTIAGKTYPALPGMKPGYFAGNAPDMGAVEFGAPQIPEGSNASLSNHVNPVMYITSTDQFVHVSASGFQLPKTGKATLSIYDCFGKLVNRPLNQNLPAGTHSINLTIPDENHFSSGHYFCQLKVADNSYVKRLVR